MGYIKLVLVFALSMPVFSLAQSTDDTDSDANTVTQEETAVEVEPVEDQDTTPARSNVEKIEVTGSHIRRTDIEGPSPVVVIDRAEIEASGMNSVGAVLRQSTASPFGSDGVTVNLRGLGSAKTLILINGQRAPAEGSSYSTGAVSTNLVPLAAVDRIEILKDGASATYGSDALGGVVNIITRKDIDGLAFANQYNMTNQNGSDSNRLSLAYGTQTSDSNFLTAIQANYVQGDRVSDRDYSGLSLFATPVYATNYFDDAENLRPGPNCQRFNDFGQCADADRSRFISDPAYGFDWVTQYSHDITSDTEFYTTLITGYGRTQSRSPVVFLEPGVGSGISFTGAESPTTWNSLPGYTGGDTKVFHRMDNLVNKETTQNYYAGLITGLKGYFGNSDWQWDATLNNQINTITDTEENVGRFSATKEAVVNGAYDPFNPAQQDVSGIGADTFNRNRYMVNWAEFKTNGSLGSFLGFDWASAFGVSAAHFEYSDHRSAIFLEGDAMGQSGVTGSAGRELYALFTELSGLMATNFEVQLSLRGDFYSDFGSTINPKLATRYQPFKWLTFRASAGTGFQAPTLQQMNTSLEGFYNNFRDPLRCGDPGIQDCALKSTTASQSLNPNLEEETSLSLNFGTVVQPTENFSLGFDYWRVKVEDVIGSAFSQALRIEDDFGPGVLANYGVQIIRQNDDPTGEIQRIIYTLQNLGTQEAEGLDFDANYRLDTGIGKFTFNNQLSYMFHFYQEFVDLYGREDIVGRQGLPRWRNNFSINYKQGRWGGFVLARSTADMLESGNISQNLKSIPSPTQFDVAATYTHDYAGEFQLGVINLGNIRPRFSVEQTIDTTLFRPTETFYFTYRNDF